MVNITSQIVNRPRAPNTSAATVIAERDAENNRRMRFVLRVTLYIVVAVAIYFGAKWVLGKVLEAVQKAPPLAGPFVDDNNKPTLTPTGAVPVKHRPLIQPAPEPVSVSVRPLVPKTGVQYIPMAQYAERVVTAKNAAAAAAHASNMVSVTTGPSISAGALNAAAHAAESAAVTGNIIWQVGLTVLLTAIAIL